MRIRTLITSTLVAVSLAGAGGIMAEAMAPVPTTTTQMLQRLAQPAEDSPQFNCAKHGNQQCGVSIDPTPNDGRTQSVRYVVQFIGGKAVSIRPLGQ